MDVYVLLTEDGDLDVLPRLMGADIEVTGPDQANGWTICGTESVVLESLEALKSFGLVVGYVIL